MLQRTDCMTTWHVWIDVGESLYDARDGIPKLAAPYLEVPATGVRDAADTAMEILLEEHPFDFDDRSRIKLILREIGGEGAFHEVELRRDAWHVTKARVVTLAEVAEDAPAGFTP